MLCLSFLTVQALQALQALQVLARARDVQGRVLQRVGREHWANALRQQQLVSYMLIVLGLPVVGDDLSVP